MSNRKLEFKSMTHDIPGAIAGTSIAMADVTLEHVKEHFRSPIVKQRIELLVNAVLRDKTFTQQIRAAVTEMAIAIAKEIVAEESSELEPRVRAIVGECFASRVESSAHEILDAKLLDIKRRLGL